MSFDAKTFMKTSFQAREEPVPVPELKAFFGGDKPEWIVRGLTGVEYGRAVDAKSRYKDLYAIVEKLMSGRSKEMANAVKGLVGGDASDPTTDTVHRIETLILGSVNPTADLELALKICEVAPHTFYALTNKISALTGKGKIPGKLPGSGEIPPSEPS